MNWPIIIIAGIGLIALIIFLVWRNMKDENKFENQLNNNYTKTKEEEGDIETEEVVK